MMQTITKSALGSSPDVQFEPVAVSIPEAAHMLGICPKNMYSLAASDGFPAVRLGKRILIPVDGLRDWINRQAKMAHKVCENAP